jgi:predicted RNA polymerase sigma factor
MWSRLAICPSAVSTSVSRSEIRSAGNGPPFRGAIRSGLSLTTALDGHHLYHATRAELLRELGQHQQARR